MSPEGVIRLVPVIPEPGPRRVQARLVRRGKHLVFEAKGIRIGPDAIARAVQEERESR